MYLSTTRLSSPAVRSSFLSTRRSQLSFTTASFWWRRFSCRLAFLNAAYGFPGHVSRLIDFQVGGNAQSRPDLVAIRIARNGGEYYRPLRRHST